jgi:hypothetical protein
MAISLSFPLSFAFPFAFAHGFHIVLSLSFASPSSPIICPILSAIALRLARNGSSSRNIASSVWQIRWQGDVPCWGWVRDSDGMCYVLNIFTCCRKPVSARGSANSLGGLRSLDPTESVRSNCPFTP